MVSKTFKRRIDENRFLIDISKKFNDSGKEFWMVGGAVRDFLLEEDTNDFDFTTNATTEEMLEILSDNGYRTTEVGRDFGTIAVHIEDQTLHITTYRKDEYVKNFAESTYIKAYSILHLQ